MVSFGPLIVDYRRQLIGETNDGAISPLFALAFLQSFVEILQEYFGIVSASATVKDNFNSVYQVSPTSNTIVYPIQ
jgi:hypothetical protein